MPDTTHPSLLSRLRNAGDSTAWSEFDARYGDLVVRFCISRGMQYSDAQDVRQLVMMSLSKTLPNFRYSRERGRFRNYLGQVVRRAVSLFHQQRRPKCLTVSLHSLSGIEPEDGRPVHDAEWEAEWVNHHYRLAMRTIRATYEPRSVQVFQRLLRGAGVREVAAEFTMTEQAVHKIKQRVRDRLGQIILQQLRNEEDQPD